ncbi:cytochrome c peroxidase [Reichenbachiella faecimaris]|uniref:Cytochrome c peroxidase n=1 Tax=Reichenbachiella faecimaris TaxID=692418 RepID=A0A1W2G6G2_REIFA|nr:cytochrome-c peroxidase [Reichenbachiella faecimaris]SMD32203.1 cytochrome c peroxidase [Reichenbachiella faecimaris]
MNSSIYRLIPLALVIIFSSCYSTDPEELEVSPDVSFEMVIATFGANIDPDHLPSYTNQNIPNYIDEDNTSGNEITDEGALLGRVLFYDNKLSSNNTISCASCHQQAFAFGDQAVASAGVNGSTGRHSMRLINARFAEEDNFFWDERANSLEEQTTMPIQDHLEMGFSGENGDPDLDSLISKLGQEGYYEELFTFAFGDAKITESRMQNALAQFIRSIVSFDSKYDDGRATAGNNNGNFSNFTDLENEGKRLFMQRADLNNQGVRVGGGFDCNTCHRAPEFDIDPDSRNNGMITAIDGSTDTDVTRSPSLRDLFGADGAANGPFMHNGFSSDFSDVLDHYESVAMGNNTDNRLFGGDGRRGGGGNNTVRNLAITDQEKEAVLAFMKTLTGSNVYTDEKWSDPFE